jgi:hypothetical protein
VIPPKLPQSLTNFADVICTVGLKRSDPIQDETILRNLRLRINQDFPELTKPKRRDDRWSFSYVSDEADIKKQATVVVDKATTFSLGWGPESEMASQFPEPAYKFLSALEEFLGLDALTFDWVDLRYVTESHWEGPHFEAVSKAFLRPGPLSSVFEAGRLVTEDLQWSGLLADDILAGIGVQTTMSKDDVRKRQYANQTLKALVGIASLDFPQNESLVDLYKRHLAVALPFLEDKFIPQVVTPLDRAIRSFSAEPGPSA